MKSGASDPFADDATVVDDGDRRGDGDERAADASESPSADEPSGTSATAEASSAPPAETDAGRDGDATVATDDRSEAEPKTGSGPTISKADLPLLLRRETVKAERENVHQLFVQDETDTRARQAENELSERLDTDVYRLDAREAIYLAGMKNLADAEEILEEWGYNF